jgi:hypothetical protein
MAESDNETPSGVKIIDRRRFDSEGAERPGENGEKMETGSGKTAPTAEQRREKEATEPHTEEREVNFSSFVISLATQALMQLGHVSPPEGVQVPVDKAAAKQTIDILALLDEKTRGNLDEEEARLLNEILHNLRLSYVKLV